MAQWKKIGRDRYWEMLEILPPAVMGGGAFMVGEPQSIDANGTPTFWGFKQTGEAYFEATSAMTIAEFSKLCPGVEPYAYDMNGEAA